MKLLFDIPRSLDNPARLRRYLRLVRTSGPHPNSVRLLRRSLLRDSKRVHHYARIERGHTV